MPQTDIGSAEASNVAAQTDTVYAVEEASTDTGDQQDKEYRYKIEDFEKHLGYYKKIPELQTAIDAKALWTIGAGFEADEMTEILLNIVKGNGKDSFNSILHSLIRTYTIAGDSFAEIIRDDEEVLVNLKPLDPSTMTIIYTKKNIIKRYEQETEQGGVVKFEADEIFHLSRNRMADEIHGMSIIPAVEWIILARNEAMADWKRVLHRNIDPVWIFHLDTDDTTTIGTFKAKMDAARGKGENMYIPKGAVVPEKVATADNSSLSPLAWIKQLNNYFFQAVGVPQIIIGNSEEFTDASGKIVYLAFEQSVKGEQLYVEEQVLAQLNIEISLTFPASLQNEVLTGQPSPLDVNAPQEEPVQQAGEQADTQMNPAQTGGGL